MNRHRRIQTRPITHRLTRVITHPPMNSRERIIRRQLPPRLLIPTRRRMRQPPLNILPRRTPHIARRQQIHIHRPTLTHRPRPRTTMQQIRQRRDVPRPVDRLTAVVDPTIELHEASSVTHPRPAATLRSPLLCTVWFVVASGASHLRSTCRFAIFVCPNATPRLACPYAPRRREPMSVNSAASVRAGVFVGLADGVAGARARGSSSRTRPTPIRQWRDCSLCRTPAVRSRHWPAGGPASPPAWTTARSKISSSSATCWTRPHPGADGGPDPLIGGVQAPCAPPVRFARRLTVGPYPLGLRLSAGRLGTPVASRVRRRRRSRQLVAADDPAHRGGSAMATRPACSPAGWNPARDRSSRARSG
jgi:hypothetical protein